MSKQNVEIVRRVYDAAVRRDTEVVFELYDKEVELDASRLGTFSTRSGDTTASEVCSANGTRLGGRSSTPMTS